MDRNGNAFNIVNLSELFLSEIWGRTKLKTAETVGFSEGALHSHSGRVRSSRPRDTHDVLKTSIQTNQRREIAYIHKQT